MTAQMNGLPVVTVHGGEDVAEVRDVIYDPKAGRLVGLTLNKRGNQPGTIHDVTFDAPTGDLDIAAHR
jgi:uncharacterized protein YrrD